MRSARRAHAGRGFSLVEMVVVVAIAAVAVGLTVYNMTRSRAQQSLERATVLLKTRLDRARAVSAVIGSRMGDPGLVTFDASCPAVPPGGFPWIYFDGAVLRMPMRVESAAPPVVTVFCDDLDPNQPTVTNGQGRFAAPPRNPVRSFYFTPSGRVVAAGGGPSVPLVLESANPGDQRTAGFRLLSSGVYCRTTDYASTNNVCDPET